MITLPPGTPVGLLVRVSDERQVKVESPTVHRNRGRDYAEDDARQWHLATVYELEGISGKTVLHQPEIRRLWRDVEAGRIKGLIFSAVARLCRNLLEALTIEEHLRGHGCAIISIRRGIIDTSTPEGMDAYISEAWRAQSERLELSARVKAGLTTRAKMGYITAAQAPYGYRKVPIPGTAKGMTLAIDEREGPIRAAIYDLYLTLRRQMAVAAELTARGLTYRDDQPWTHHHVKDLLLDTTAMGIYYANRTGADGDKPEHEWIPISVPALVSVETWKRCNLALAARQLPQRKVVYPYSGLLYCYCGAKLYVTANYDHARQAERFHPRYDCRACGNAIQITPLDAALGTLFRAFLLDGIPDDAEPEVSRAEQRLQSLKKRLKTIGQSKQRFAKAFGAGKLSLEDFGAYHGPLVEQEKAIQAEVAQLEAEQISAADQLDAQQQAADALQHVTWAELEPRHKQRLLSAFVEQIVLHPLELQIDMLFMPSLLQLAEGEDEPTGFARRLRRTVRRPDVMVMPADRRAWGHCLRTTRIARGETTKAVARRLKTNESQITRWELLVAPPAPAKVPLILSYTGYVPWCRTPYAQPTLGEAFRAARELRGLTQTGLSKLTGVSQAMISLLELNQTGLSPDAFAALERGLKLDVRRVFGVYSERINNARKG